MKANLHISTQCRDGKTFLKECFFQPPFKVADIREDKSDAVLKLMLMSTSPGILSNDEYEVKIVVKENSSLELFTQSYQRLYTMKQQAKQYTLIEVEENASFVFIPHPQVPHRQSSYEAENEIYLTDSSTLVWGEIISCGRKLSGEIFEFSKYHSKTSIFRNNKILIRENQLMQPAQWPVNVLGQMQGFTHQGTLIIVHADHTVTATIELLRHHLSEQNEIHYGITIAPGISVLVRILGYHAEQLFELLNNLNRLFQTIIKQEPVQ